MIAKSGGASEGNPVNRPWAWEVKEPFLMARMADDAHLSSHGIPRADTSKLPRYSIGYGQLENSFLDTSDAATPLRSSVTRMIPVVSDIPLTGDLEIRPTAETTIRLCADTCRKSQSYFVTMSEDQEIDFASGQGGCELFAQGRGFEVSWPTRPSSIRFDTLFRREGSRMVLPPVVNRDDGKVLYGDRDGDRLAGSILTLRIFESTSSEPVVVDTGMTQPGLYLDLTTPSPAGWLALKQVRLIGASSCEDAAGRLAAYASNFTAEILRGTLRVGASDVLTLSSGDEVRLNGTMKGFRVENEVGGAFHVSGKALGVYVNGKEVLDSIWSSLSDGVKGALVAAFLGMEAWIWRDKFQRRREDG